MNKTVYLRDDEVTVWEKARELAADKLSPIIVAALRRFIAEKEAFGKGFERIEVKFDDSEDHNLPKVKAFYGRWIFDKRDPLKLEFKNGPALGVFAVAETAKGNVVVFTYNEDKGKTWGHKFCIYQGFEAAAKDIYVNLAIRQAMEKRGVPVEELDI